MNKLDSRTEKFVQLVHENKWDSVRPDVRAFKEAFPVKCEKMTKEAVIWAAGKLFFSPSVQKMLEELKDRARARHGITVENLLCELDENRNKALNPGSSSRSGRDGEVVESDFPPQVSAANAATMGKAKLTGLDQPEAIKIDHISSDGSMTPPDSITVISEGISDSEAAEEYRKIMEKLDRT